MLFHVLLFVSSRVNAALNADAETRGQAHIDANSIESIRGHMPEECQRAKEQHEWEKERWEQERERCWQNDNHMDKASCQENCPT